MKWIEFSIIISLLLFYLGWKSNNDEEWKSWWSKHQKLQNYLFVPLLVIVGIFTALVIFGIFITGLEHY